MLGNFFIGSVFALYTVLVLSTVAVVVLENRQPAKTIAWIVVLVGLPVAGLVFFYFFGQNVRKERFLHRNNYGRLAQRMATESRNDGNCPPPAAYTPLIRLFGRKRQAVLSGGNEVTLLNDGQEFVTALLREIAGAEDHIHLETYIIENDAVGRLLRDALAEAAARGVEVRLIYDDVGCWNVGNSFFESCRKSGIHAVPFLPVHFPSLTHKVNYRNHRKICVVDGRTGFIGGMNLALRYVSRREGPWHDLQLCVRGGSVGGLQRIFLNDWDFVTGEAPQAPRFFPAMEERGHTGVLVQIVSANPATRYPEIMYGLTRAIQNARNYLYIQTPYFMPTEPVLQALQSAAMSGVDVRLMVPQKPDAFFLRWANDSYFEDVLKAGVRVFRYRSRFLHSKCVVADDDWCTVGSSNMDFRSFENNFEANAFVYDRTVAQTAKAVFLSDLRECEEILPEVWEKRPYGRRFLESGTRIFSPLM